MTMPATQDIATAAEAHTVSYIAVLLSTTTTPLRAASMATYYLPNVASFIDGSAAMMSGQADCTAAIEATLENLETDNGRIKYFEEKGHTIKVIGEGSAIVDITFRRKGIVWTNMYFFRRKESGEVGWEGGIFDGEARMLRELAKE
jgi:hypothetical protein